MRWLPSGYITPVCTESCGSPSDPSKLHLPPRSRPSNINGPSGRIRTRDFLKFWWKAALSPFRGLFNVIGYGNDGQVTIGIMLYLSEIFRRFLANSVFSGV